MKHLLIAAFLFSTAALATTYIEENLLWANDCEYKMWQVVDLSKGPFVGMSGQEAASYVDQHMMWADDEESDIVHDVMTR